MVYSSPSVSSKSNLSIVIRPFLICPIGIKSLESNCSYNSSVFLTIRSAVKCCVACRRAQAARCAATAVEVSAVRNAFANAAASLGLTAQATGDDLFSNNSGIPPAVVVTTGRAASIASMSEDPNPSNWEASVHTSAAWIRSGTSSR